MKRVAKISFAALAVAALASPAFAAYSFPSFNQVVTSTVTSTLLNTAPVPAGVYTSYSVMVDWSAIAGDPWSDEGIWAFGDTAYPATTYYADPGPAPNSASNGNPVTLVWNGFMDTPWTAGNPLYFLTLQTFGGSSANWNNIRITIGMDTPTAPVAIDLGTLTPGMTMDMRALAAGEILWYKFTVPAGGVNGGIGQYLNINTFGSDLSMGAFAEDDTEIGLYSSLGGVLASNDDANFGGGVYTSELHYGAGAGTYQPSLGNLGAGTYYIAVGGFNTTYAGNFGASSASTAFGTIKLTLDTNVPEPTTMALLALGGLVAIRRRK
ncbi:MAG: PEP-CTERM sorting domain-containing protein [Phycisphaerae bacterium]|nr:PEP-CTERM sorting domain-containing protein [Phycisphaerae bacterium]